MKIITSTRAARSDNEIYVVVGGQVSNKEHMVKI